MNQIVFDNASKKLKDILNEYLDTDFRYSAKSIAISRRSSEFKEVYKNYQALVATGFKLYQIETQKFKSNSLSEKENSAE